MRKAFNSLDCALLLQFVHQVGICSTKIQGFSSYISDHVQRVKYNHSSFGWGPVLGEFPQRNALGPLLFLIYVNDMLLQTQNGSLLQFADNTCLICYSDNHVQGKDFLSSNLDSLARWIATSKMQVNVDKSHEMWFSVKSFNSLTTVPPILLEGIHLVNVSKQNTWESLLIITCVANVYKTITYYLF